MNSVKTALILADGQPPSKSLLESCRRSASIFVCADGGANIAARYNLKPHLIIGDLDSVNARTLKKFQQVPTRRLTEQNSTDLEKALRWLIQKNCKNIVVLGALGKRFDHSIGNVSALAKFSGQANVRFVDRNAELICVGRDYSFEVAKGTTVSLIPLSLCQGVVTSGLKWELNNESLQLGVREGTSNVVASSPVRIRVRRGALILYRFINGGSTRTRALHKHS